MGAIGGGELLAQPNRTTDHCCSATTRPVFPLYPCVLQAPVLRRVPKGPVQRVAGALAEVDGGKKEGERLCGKGVRGAWL